MDSANDMPMTPDNAVSSQYQEVEFLAFQFWQERGAPIGTPDVDWFRAEDELKGPGKNAEPALSAVAKTIGSALGSVAALVRTAP
jgi:hypothetical protein